MKKVYVLILVVLGVAALGSLGYSYWLAPNPMSKYRLKACKVPAERRGELETLMEHIKKCSETGRLSSLESDFTMSRKDRRIAKVHGREDPVEIAMELLKRYGNELDWGVYEMYTYDHNSRRFEVKTKSRNGDVALRFTFRKRKKKYSIVAVTKI